MGEITDEYRAAYEEWRRLNPAPPPPPAAPRVFMRLWPNSARYMNAQLDRELAGNGYIAGWNGVKYVPGRR